MQRTRAQGLFRVVIGWTFGLLVAFPVQANDGGFAVRVRVRTAPAVAPAAHLDTLPMPDGARRLTRSLAGDSYWLDGSAEAAAAHFHRAMPAHGYRLVQAGQGGSTWVDATRRVEVRLQPVLGGTPATRILVAP